MTPWHAADIGYEEAEQRITPRIGHVLLNLSYFGLNYMCVGKGSRANP
jgi:hypothetical protein